MENPIILDVNSQLEYQLYLISSQEHYHWYTICCWCQLWAMQWLA